MAEDDKARRKSEISMFAKLASGDTFQGIPSDETNDEEKQEKAAFAAISSVEDSGTFAMTSLPNTLEDVASSNLDAAAAAFTVGEEDSWQPPEDPEEELNLRHATYRPPLEPTPMYNERVLLPRPLFYGPVLPPRVIKEAREAVFETMKELNLDLNKRPRLSQLPPHIKNVVGAIESFGFGIPIFPSDVSDEDSFRGSEYVSTYQPVWGDVARAEREALRKRNYEETGESMGPSPARETTQEEEAPVTHAGESSSGATADPLTPRNNKSARGGIESNLVVSTSFPGGKSPNSVTKSRLLRSKSAPVNKLVPPAMSDKDQFLQWARGKPTTPPKNYLSESFPKKSDKTQDDVELFSRCARGKPASTPPGIVKRSKTTSEDRHFFSRWAQGDADQSPIVKAGRKVEGSGMVDTYDGTGNDVRLFSRWARGEPSDSPIVMEGKSCPDSDELDDTATESSAKPASIPIPHKSLFFWNPPSSTPPPPPSPEHKPGKELGATIDGHIENFSFAQRARGEPEKDGNSVNNTPMSDQDKFSQWARGELLDTIDGSMDASIRSGTTSQPYDTFCAAPPTVDDDYSDDDSVDRSELKKKVGMNEHLNAALASLANATPGDRTMPTGTESIEADEANLLLSQIGATTDGGRPLSNFEITNGSVPLFGCDDSPLPSEADLGIFQTKEEQMRNFELRRSQVIIDEHTYPNIFGPIACPNPAQGPDDNHSWYSRTIPARKHVAPTAASGHQINGPGIVPVLGSPSSEETKGKHYTGKHSPLTVDGESERSTHSDMGDTPSTHSVSSMSRKAGPKTTRKRPPVPPSASRQDLPRNMSFDANARFGWWNIPDENDNSAISSNDDKKPLSDSSPPLQLPPIDYASTATPVITRLTPTAEELREENLPLSNLHAASSIAGALPFLSDRPPSFRYLQIDTEAVGFPSLGGEIEPLFCSLAIYHVETTAPNRLDPRAAPMPNMQRCGRVTEVLNFDVVRDPEVEARCIHALWPYVSCLDEQVPATPPGSPHQATQGSRCGVFPLASNLSISNLYAILIVHKVLSDKEGVEPYTKLSNPEVKGTASRSDSEIEKLRDKAEKMSRRHGHFLMPFAFGVAPLLQIFGTDIPTVVSSRAVQIPLFRFITGQGDRPIIDHIMIMLYPR